MVNRFGAVRMPSPSYVALFFLIFTVLIADYKGLRRCNSLKPELSQHTTALWTLDHRANVLNREIDTLKRQTDALKPELREHAFAIERLHRAVDSLKLTYNELRLLIGVWNETSANPAVGTFHTGEVRRMDQSSGHTSKMVSFPKPYRLRPGIPVGLMWLDAGNNNNIRVQCYSSNIDETYFEINIDTWSGTQLYQASCAWMEIGPSHPDFQYGTYNTLEDHSWKDYRATNTRKVVFLHEYDVPPKVVVWLSALDMLWNRNWRVRAYATHITTTGFTLHIDTWGDSVLYSAAASWVSHPPDMPGVVSGSFSTSDPSGVTQLSTTGFAAFDRGVFDFPPRTIMGINSLDIDRDRNLRIAVGATAVHANGMAWHLNSWGDTKLYSASASYIALG